MCPRTCRNRRPARSPESYRRGPQSTSRRTMQHWAALLPTPAVAAKAHRPQPSKCKQSKPVAAKARPTQPHFGALRDIIRMSPDGTAATSRPRRERLRLSSYSAFTLTSKRYINKLYTPFRPGRRALKTRESRASWVGRGAGQRLGGHEDCRIRARIAGALFVQRQDRTRHQSNQSIHSRA